MNRWTDEHGTFVGSADKERDLGTWRQEGVSGGGRASAQVLRCHDGSWHVGVETCANMTPAEALKLARVLTDAACKAAEETWKAEALALAKEKFNGELDRARIEKTMTQYNEED